MKIMQEIIDFPGRTAVKVKCREMPHFTYPWHFHNEYEILYILKGNGTSFVADNIESFGPGDLVLLGHNLPHFWKSDTSYFYKGSNKSVQYIVIQLPSDLFNEKLFQYAEFSKLKDLLKNSARGIRFLPSFSERAGKKILSIARKSGFDRMIEVLKLLQSMSTTEDYRLLAGELYQESLPDFTSDRLSKVMHYLNSRYRGRIRLNEVAEVANMNPAAFSRYFSEKTGKSLSRFVSDMRLSYACKLIIEGQLSISQVCFETGFNNLSNFNRAFKRHTGLTPTEYYLQFCR